MPEPISYIPLTKGRKLPEEVILNLFVASPSKAVANTIDVGLDVDVKGASAIAETTAEIALASPVSASFAANPKRPRNSPFWMSESDVCKTKESICIIQY